ncbi:MAG TPA: hypothetical protein VH643_28640 [Gemmataceae bacterium]
MSDVLTRSPSVSWYSENATLAVLARLLGNYRCARMLRCSPWKYALRAAELREVGLAEVLLRQLVEGGTIEYRSDLPVEAEIFTASLGLGRGDGYVVLTPAGARAARERLLAVRDEQLAIGENRLDRAGAAQRPRWDGLVRELTLGRRLVKRFRRPGPNQECILTAFEGLGWPERIDDPLPREHGVPSLVRLRETVKSLNQGHVQPLLRFRIEPSGRGIRWKLVE